MWSKLFGCRDELPECSRSIERAVEAISTRLCHEEERSREKACAPW